ncbi:hypothetical protein Tco_0041099 [Tanacetum coccineum]
MKRGFRGVPRPLLPAMLPVAVVDQSAGPSDQAEDQPSSSEPLPSLSHPHTEHIFEQPSPEHQPLSPRQETEVPQSQDTSHPHVPEARTMISREHYFNGSGKGYFIDDDPLGSKGDFVTPTKPSGEVDKGKRYKRRKESKGKDIRTGFEEVNTGFEKVNAGGSGVSTGNGPVSSARGQREGKAPMITLEEEETAKQVHLDALLVKRMEEEELTEQQKQRKAQVQFKAQYYTKEDWDAIRAKLEANAE